MANNSSAQELLSASSCFNLPDQWLHQVSERVLLNLVTAIINIISAPFAVVFNFLIATAIFKNARLRVPSNLMIGCLAFSDILVGLAVQPGYITFRLLENQLRSVPCFVRFGYSNALYICFGVSFMTLAAVSYERLVAVRLQARYNNVFSSKRVVKYMAAIWIFNILLASLRWTRIKQVARGTHLIVWFLSFLVSGIANVGIVLILRRHRHQVQPFLHPTIEQIRKQRDERLTRSISFIVGVYLLLNTPILFVAIYHQTLKQDIKTYNHYSWAETLAFLNSCTNPLICYWKNRQIRQEVKSTVKRLICCN